VQLVLARMDFLLSTNSKHRQLFTEIQSDWQLVQQAEQFMAARGTQVIAAKQ
jgi:hypothetical protein